MPLALGKAVHKGIELKIHGVPHSEAVLNGWAEADFHPEVSYQDISRLVNNAPIRKGGKTEVYFKLPLSSFPSAPQLQGYIDLIQGNKIVDWKTNWRPYSVLENHQMGLYAWALHKLKGYQWIEGSLYFLRYRKESKHFFNLLDIEKARTWAETLANEIESKLSILDMLPEAKNQLFPDSPSKSCRHCSFVVTCYKNTKGSVLRNDRKENLCI